MSNGAKALGKYVNRNSISPSSEPPAVYTFPPVEPSRQPDYGRKVSSPGWEHSANRERSPSANMVIDRHPSISSGRYESGRPQPLEPAQSRTTQNSLCRLPPLPPLPPLIKSNSLKKPLSHSSQHFIISDSTRGAKDNPTESGRRNSVIMSVHLETYMGSRYDILYNSPVRGRARYIAFDVVLSQVVGDGDLDELRQFSQLRQFM